MATVCIFILYSEETTLIKKFKILIDAGSQSNQ